MYIILGYIAGFLGIALGFFIHFALLSTQTSFGVPFFTPYVPFNSLSKNENLYMPPVWGRERRDQFLNTKKPNSQKHISMRWRQHG